MKLLVVVDYQNDFVDGALGFEGASSIEQAILDKIASYRAAGDQVAFTFDTHTEAYLTTQEGVHLPVVHCVQDTPGWQLREALEQTRQPQDLVFKKPCFGSAELFDYLRAHSFDMIELCGLVSHICVLSNAILAKTAAPETPIVVDARATASFSPQLHTAALDVLEGVQVQVIHRAAPSHA